MANENGKWQEHTKDSQLLMKKSQGKARTTSSQ